MILGFIGVFVLVGLVAVLVSTDSSEAQVAIISPKDGARVEAGKVPVRIRIEDGAVARWELSVTALDAATTRIPLARGGSGQNIGVYFVDLLQPGTYEVSLKVTDGEGNSSEVLSVFHVGD